MPTATYFGGSCVLDESVLHAGTMFGPAGATSACSLALVRATGTLGWPYIFSFWSFYSHIRPAECQMVTLLINNFCIGLVHFPSESQIRQVGDIPVPANPECALVDIPCVLGVHPDRHGSHDERPVRHRTSVQVQPARHRTSRHPGEVFGYL